MGNKRHPKNFIFVRILASLVILSAIFFQYTNSISPSTTTLVTLVTLVIFFTIESISRKKFLNKQA